MSRALSVAPNLGTHPPDAVRAAIDGLSAADAVRLRQLARLRAVAAPGWEWSDLLQEAFARALNSQRLWPMDVPFVAFIAQTMRSLASDAARVASLEPTSIEAMTEPDEVPTTAGQLLHHDLTPERSASARQSLVRLEAAFTDDAEGWAVLLAQAEGDDAATIRASLGLNATRYATVLRRIRRRLLTLDDQRENFHHVR